MSEDATLTCILFQTRTDQKFDLKYLYSRPIKGVSVELVNHDQMNALFTGAKFIFVESDLAQKTRDVSDMISDMGGVVPLNVVWLESFPIPNPTDRKKLIDVCYGDQRRFESCRFCIRADVPLNIGVNFFAVWKVVFKLAPQ